MNLPIAGTAPSCGTPESVCLEDLHFAYGSLTILHGVNLQVPRGAFFTLLGPSGCGKTTLLKLVGGYLRPSRGRIRLRGLDVTGMPPEARGLGMVFQNYALFPHLTARQNVAFGLEVRGRPRKDILSRVEEILDRVDLPMADRDRIPARLSGGQQQRVALARALAFAPDILLLDEPLANLDRHLREQLREELQRLHKISGTTTWMVTHDQDEALASSHLVGVMKAGRLVQWGPPREVYERPRTPFVAKFLGPANLISGKFLGIPTDLPVLVRPENIHLGGPLQGVVVSSTYHGSDVAATIDCRGVLLGIRVRASSDLHPGQAVTLGIPNTACWPIPETDLF